MLIEEITGINVLNEVSQSSLKTTLDQLILRLRVDNVSEISMTDLIKNLNALIPNMYLDPKNADLRNTVSMMLSDNNWADAEADNVHIKKTGDIEEIGKSIGKSAEVAAKAQKSKVQKMALKNVQKKADLSI